MLRLIFPNTWDSTLGAHTSVRIHDIHIYIRIYTATHIVRKNSLYIRSCAQWRVNKLPCPNLKLRHRIFARVGKQKSLISSENTHLIIYQIYIAAINLKKFLLQIHLFASRGRRRTPTANSPLSLSVSVTAIEQKRSERKRARERKTVVAWCLRREHHRAANVRPRALRTALHQASRHGRKTGIHK